MVKKVETDKAPKAIGPYSQAIEAGGFLFVSGQIPVDPKTGEVVERTIQAQTVQVLKNIEAILQARNLSFAHVVKASIFLKNLDDFKEVNALYAEKFPHAHKPARETVQVAKLPLDVLLEISCIAAL